MSGHSHWATIKHKKGTADARRGKLWSKLCRAIQISAKDGGGNPDMNLKLANAILDARAESVPNENITRSIKRGTGELEGISYEQVTYEGYGPGGVAFMIDALTDNKNRSAAEMRKMFENSNGNLAGAKAVAHMFQRKGLLIILVAAAGEDQMMNDVLESGAENMETAGDSYFITCAVPDFENVKKALAKKYKVTSSEIAMIPKDVVKVDEETGRKIINLMENLDDSEDVQKIYHNFVLPESLLGKYVRLVKLAVTLGDPAGIGPEVVDKALRETASDAELVLIGSRSGGGKEALAAIDEAIDLALAKKVDGIVTAPVSKERIAKTGVPFVGHTEHLAARAGVKTPVMLFVAGPLRVALVTTHVSLRKLPAMITPDRILGILRETSKGLRDFFGVLEPRLAVCGLNPHAGEAGEFGREEIEIIAPAVEAARKEGLKAEGPYAADTVWKRPCDAIVAMYHDQGLGPIKAMHPDAVNVTLGLPFVRTSPDHGTAFDIAGKGIADPKPMIAAIRLAAEMCRAKKTLF